MSANKEGYSATFYALAAVGVVGVIGGLYYIYTVINDEEEPSEQANQKIEAIQQELESANGPVTVDQAIHILALVNKLTEDISRKNKPDLDDRRRAAINNQQLYEMLMGETMEAKEEAMSKAQEIISRKFPSVNMEEIGKVMQSTDAVALEKKVLKVYPPTFEGTQPDRKTIKEAFIYYATHLNATMRENQMAMNNVTDPQQQQYLFFKMIMAKNKVDDEFYNKYSLTENQLKFLLYEYNLEDEPEVKEIFDKLNKFSDMMG